MNHFFKKVISNVRNIPDIPDISEKVILSTMVVGGVSGSIIATMNLHIKEPTQYVLHGITGWIVGSSCGFWIGITLPVWIVGGIVGSSVGGGIYIYDKYNKSNKS